MTEQELRALVRDAIARHGAARAGRAARSPAPCRAVLQSRTPSHAHVRAARRRRRRRALHHRARRGVQPLRLLQVVRTLSAGSLRRRSAFLVTRQSLPVVPSMLARLEAARATSTRTTARRRCRTTSWSRASRGKQGLVSMVTDTIDRAVHRGRHAICKVVANVAVGYNNIDVAAARERGIIVTNTPDVLTEATADLTLGADPRHHAAHRRRRAAGAARRLEGLGVRLHARHRSCAASSSASSASAASAGRWPRAPRRSACASPTRRAPKPGRRRGDAARSPALDLRRRLAALPADAGDAAPDRPAGAGADEAQRRI